MSISSGRGRRAESDVDVDAAALDLLRHQSTALRSFFSERARRRARVQAAMGRVAGPALSLPPQSRDERRPER